jgi:hypothetical protein
MADITMCTNKECPLSFSCYRAKAIPNEYWQAYQFFKPRIDEELDEVECSNYVFDERGAVLDNDK